MRRAVKDGAGNILQRIDYYPFGSVSSGWSSSTTPTQPTLRYRFSGKEIAGQSVGASAPAGTPAAAVGNPYLDFGARLYDPRTASWLAHDPMSEKYNGISPFAYCAGNPVNFTDPDGQDVLDKLFGLLIGFITNIVPGSGYLRDLYRPNNTRDYNSALEITDRAAETAGVFSIGAGSAGAATGAAMAAAGGGMALSVAGAPEGVILAGTGATLFAEGTELALAGANLKANASANKARGYERGNSNHSDQETVTYTQGRGDEAKRASLKVPEGYRKVRVRGRRHSPIYTNGKDYISPDLDNHNGGSWKRAKSIKDLERRETRMGTYDESLKIRIGD